MDRAEYYREKHAHEAHMERIWEAREEAAERKRQIESSIKDLMDEITADHNRVLNASLYQEILSFDYNISAQDLDDHAAFIAAYTADLEKREEEEWEED